MKWFEGTIPEAINSSKAKKAVFVVFIEGKDDTSQEVARVLNSPEVSSRLGSEKFVAIKLQSDSENYTFFAQIYQLVPVPSIFFIGENGAPLEIIGNALPAAELATKIDSILAKANPQAGNASTNFIEAEQKTHSSANSAQDAGKPQGTSSETKESSNDGAASGGAGAEAASEEEIPANETAEEKAARELSQEEKLRRARELIELQQKKKQEEEERREREREIERRKMGRDIQKLRQQQQDKEIREAQQERLREKRAEAAARDKILKQIAEDKLERKRKHDMQMQEKNSQQQKKLQEDAQNKVKAQAASVDLSKTRIQFKMPTGNPITGTFDSTSTLGTLRSYVLQNGQLPFRQFSMSAFFPRKDFTAADDDKTLLELDLAPSSVILILPVKSTIPTSVIKSSDGPGIFSHFFWTLLAPVVSIYNYVMGYFTGRPRAGESDSSNRNSGSSADAGNASAPFDRLARFGMRRMGGNEGTKIRARGNVHTLRSSDNDNDENNTWNGNSTQQM